jgi:hypothetical protein
MTLMDAIGLVFTLKILPYLGQYDFKHKQRLRS